MAEAKCDDCKGKGHVTTVIAGDVHIAECKECLGWGTVSVKKVAKNRLYGQFGKLKHSHSVNIDELLKE
jgi:DnaJ-class molecular chaperone